MQEPVAELDEEDRHGGVPPEDEEARAARSAPGGGGGPAPVVGRLSQPGPIEDGPLTLGWCGPTVFWARAAGQRGEVDNSLLINQT